MSGLSDAAKVGLVVVAVVVLFGGAVQLIRGIPLFENTYIVLVRFDNAMGLKNRMTLRMAGLDSGWVADTKPEPGTGKAIAKIRVRKGIVLHEDAEFTIGQEGLIGEKYLSMTLGDPGKPVAAEGYIFTGQNQADVGQLVSDLSGVASTMQGIFSEVVLPVAGIDLAANAFEVADNYADRFRAGDRVDITNTPNNNGSFKVVADASYEAGLGRTLIKVDHELHESPSMGSISKQALGSTIAELSGTLKESLHEVSGLLEQTSTILGGSQGAITSTLGNVKAMSANFLTISQRLEKTSKTVDELASDPRYRDLIDKLANNLGETSDNFNSLSAELNRLISDPAVQNDAKESLRMTRRTMQEAATTLMRLQGTIDKVNGVVEGAGGLVDKAGGTIDEAREKLDKFSSVGQSVDVQAGFDVRGVDTDRNHRPGGGDSYVGDINAGIGYKGMYVIGGADNIGEHTGANLLVGVGKLNKGASLRGGVYRGELGIGGAYYLPGGGGLAAMYYDTRDPKLNAYGYLPVGNAVEVIVGMEDIDNNPQASVGLGVKLGNKKK